MKRDTYRQRPERKVQGVCRVCDHDRRLHTYGWPVGCKGSCGECTCPQVFVEVGP